MHSRFRHFVLAALVSTPLLAQPLRIYHIDVEQGDATLLVAPNGKTLLVDGGRTSDGLRIKAAMDAAGVNRIDFFVNTHYHGNHLGGIDELAALGVEIVTSFDRGDKRFVPERKKQLATYQDYQGSVGKSAKQLRRGMTIPLDPGMTVTCIASGGVVMGEERPASGVREHDMSVSLLINLGDFQYFVGGDLERHGESKIAARDLVLDVDVYRANNHGVDSSSSPAFLEDLRPTVVIISNGNDATYQHPRRNTLQAYQALPAPPSVFQTNKYLSGGAGGNVPDEFIADLESSDADGTVLVAVDNSASQFTVSFAPNVFYRFAVKRRRPFEAAVQSRVPAIPEVVSPPPRTSLVESTPPKASPVESAPPKTSFVESAASGNPSVESAPRGTSFLLYASLLVLVCGTVGIAGFIWTTGGREENSDRAAPQTAEVDPVGSGVARRTAVSEPIPAPPAEKETSSRSRLVWKRFPASKIPKQLKESARYIWIRIQPGSLTSRQGYVNVDFAGGIDFLTDVPAAIDNETCKSVEQRSVTSDEQAAIGTATLDVYNKGATLLAALGNCCDADKAFLLKAEVDSWLKEIDSAIASDFSPETVGLVLNIEGGNVKQQTERVLGRLLRVMESHPRVRNVQDTTISLQAGSSVGPGAQAFRDSFTAFELEQLLDIGALEEC